MPRFAHHRLDAYHAALDLADAGHRLARQIPHGYRWLGDHLIRAVCATPVLTAEGANRTSPGTKRQRFAEALGYVGDRETIPPLADIMNDEKAQAVTRAYATLALGTIGDDNNIPALSDFFAGCNYLASTQTLSLLQRIMNS